MDPAGTPDAWDQGDEASTGAKFRTLNVSASPFVPGKNVMAATFVPGGGGGGGGATTTYSQPPQQQPPVQQQLPPQINTQGKLGLPPDSASMNSLAVEVGSECPEETDSVGEWDSTKEGDINESSETESQTMEDNAQAEPVRMTIGDAPEEEEPREIMEAKQVAKKKKEVTEFSGANKKEHVNIVFIGHVDAGKSTIGGRILQATGMVDQRTLEKYEKEAKEKNRETWYLSWALDTNNEERDKGKTVEVGRAYFETEKRHFTILDAPGHKSFVPNMIGGASQADIAVLVISARKGEFETGFERGGQTMEHAMLVKTAGVKYLIILINKMDDPTVQWDGTRYAECRDKLLPYLKKIGFNTKKDVTCIPCSGLTGAFIKEKPAQPISWYTGPTFLEFLELLPSFVRTTDGPVRIPIVDRYKDMGTIALGKLESGQICLGQKLVILPNKKDTEVMSIWTDDIEAEVANAGENVKIKLKNVEEEDVLQGFVICSPTDFCHTARIFDAQVMILEHKSIICAGYSAVLHLHTGAEEVTIQVLINQIDRKSGESIKVNGKTQRPKFIKQDQVATVRFQLNGGLMCMEKYEDFPQMGRFTLRDEGKTVAVGKVLKIVS